MRPLWLNGKAVVILAFVRVILPRLGVERTLCISASFGACVPSGPQTSGSVVRAVRGASRRLLPRSACLAQSITVAALLARKGAAPDLVLGCRLTESGWVAHAWVEYVGERIDPLPAGPQLELGRYQRAGKWRLAPAGTQEIDPSSTADDAPKSAGCAYPV